MLAKYVVLRCGELGLNKINGLIINMNIMKSLGYQSYDPNSDTPWSKHYIKNVTMNLNEGLGEIGLPLAAFPIKTKYQIIVGEFEQGEDSKYYELSVRFLSSNDKSIKLKFYALQAEEIITTEQQIEKIYQDLKCMPVQILE